MVGIVLLVANNIFFAPRRMRYFRPIVGGLGFFFVFALVLIKFIGIFVSALNILPLTPSALSDSRVCFGGHKRKHGGGGETGQIAPTSSSGGIAKTTHALLLR